MPSLGNQRGSYSWRVVSCLNYKVNTQNKGSETEELNLKPNEFWTDLFILFSVKRIRLDFQSREQVEQMWQVPHKKAKYQTKYNNKNEIKIHRRKESFKCFSTMATIKMHRRKFHQRIWNLKTRTPTQGSRDYRAIWKEI